MLQRRRLYRCNDLEAARASSTRHTRILVMSDRHQHADQKVGEIRAVDPFRVRGIVVHAIQGTVVRWDTNAQDSGFRARSQEARPKGHQR